MKFKFNVDLNLKMALSRAQLGTYDQNGGGLTTKTKAVRTKRSVNDYQELSHPEHIYMKPDTYIGSCDKTMEQIWMFDPEANKLFYGNSQLPEGVIRLFIEVISNAGDNADSSRRMGTAPGMIEISMDNKLVTIRNGGEPIPLLPTPNSTQDKPLYVPDSIFGKLLTSSNYDVTVIRMGGGTNGYGAKLANIFSAYMMIKIGDPKNGQEWIGIWRDNMRTIVQSQVTPGHVWTQNGWALKGTAYTGPAYVEVTYSLDFPRFGYVEYPVEAQAIFARCLIDYSFTCKIPVSLNGKVYNVQRIKDYAKLYWAPEIVDKCIIHYEWANGIEPPGFATMSKKQKEEIVANPPSVEYIPIVEIACFDTPDAGVCLSHVNGLVTKNGGVHTVAAYKAIAEIILAKFDHKPKKGAKKEEKAPIKLTLADVQAHLSLIVTVRVPDPKFDSQSKHKLNTPTPIINIEEAELKPMHNWDLFERMSSQLDAKMFKLITKGEGKKRRVHLDKGTDANEAGGPKSSQCILYLVEGKSASTYPKHRIAKTPGNKDFNAYYPLKGKYPNVSKMSPYDISQNDEIKGIKALMNLREGVDYDDPKEFATLRYGMIIITTDADSDGSHILMLLINWFHEKYPSLIRRNIITYLTTPAVRIYSDKRQKNCIGKFNSVSEYERWEKVNPGITYYPKFFKGLASSLNKDIEDDMTSAPLILCFYDETSAQHIDMAFGKDNAKMRKLWMAKWREEAQIGEPTFVPIQDILKGRSITDIINKDLVNYTIDSLFRAIPSNAGLIKKSQCQLLTYMLQHWKYGKSDGAAMKIDSIACAASELTHYHHGSTSMEDTVVKMCNEFVGTNNLSLFTRDGQLGTRDENGKDVGAPRYIFTRTADWIEYAVHKEMIDLIPVRMAEGLKAEPEWIPFDVPIGVINGFSGIATGHSTYLPPHNPYEVIDYILHLCCDQKPPFRLKPAFRGFKGTVEVTNSRFNVKSDEEESALFDAPLEEEEEVLPEEGGKRKGRSVVTTGVFEILRHHPDGAVDVKVTELPIGVSIDSYRLWIISLEKDKVIHSFKDNSTNDVPLFVINKFKHIDGVSHKTLRLIRSFGMENITLIDHKGFPKVYNDVHEVIDCYFAQMIEVYGQLQAKMIEEATADYAQCAWKREMIVRVVSGDILLFDNKRSRDEEDVYRQMDIYNIPHDVFDKITIKECTTKKIAAIEKTMEALLAKLEEYKSYTPKSMWYNNLIKLRAYLVKKGYSMDEIKEI
jgi:DNA topoisomerase-2